MLTMLSFFTKRHRLGIEITASAIRLAALTGGGDNRSVVFLKTVELPAGLVNESYAAQNINDRDHLTALLRETLSGASALHLKRTALSLPDSIFRIQMYEFDELPKRAAECEKLIRWRLEKSAFDIADTTLRYQVKKREKGYFVLACAAKQAVISQYEAVLSGLGLESWFIGPSSFNILNFYFSYLVKASPIAALTHVAKDSFTTIVAESGEARFYRYKELKRAGADGIQAKLVREIGDSLHFYAHKDRSKQADIGRLYLSGDVGLPSDLPERLSDMTSLDVEVLSPAVVLPSANGAGPAMAAALGAGRGL
jgi:Tfp pilus assembly PilM family ATPase